MLSSKKERLILALFSIYVIGAHLRLSLHSGGTVFVPMFMMVFSGLAVAMLFSRAIWRRIGLTFLILCAFFSVQPLLGAEVYNYGTVTKNVVQIMISIFLAMAIVFGLRNVRKDKLRRVVLFLWISFIILAFVEITFLKSTFDLIRDFLYSGTGRGIYSATERDIGIYGQIRATALASEPSFLSDTLAALIVMTFMLSPNIYAWRPWALLVAMTLVSVMVVPSFKMAFFILALFFWIFWPQSLLKTSTVMLVLFAFGAVFLVSSDVFLSFIISFGGNHADTGSFFGRIGSAHVVGSEALSMFPVFGFGVGNREAVYPIIVNTWNTTGAFSRFPWYSDGQAENLLSNGFWWMWIYLGIVGGLFFLWMISQILRRAGVQTPWRSMACAAIVWYAGSAFVDPQSWFVVVVFSIGALKFKSEYVPSTQSLSQ